MPDAPRDPDDDRQLELTVELVKRAQEGDSSALESLLERYDGPVRGLVRQRLGTELRGQLDSGDMVQEAMVEVLEGLGRFRPEGERAFIRWLSVLVENRLRELVRYHRAGKRDHGRKVRLDAGDSLEPARQDPAWVGETPSQEASSSEAREIYARALEALAAPHRRVIERRNQGGDWATIASELELPSPAAARMLHSRAKLALIKLVSGAGAADGGPNGARTDS